MGSFFRVSTATSGPLIKVPPGQPHPEQFTITKIVPSENKKYYLIEVHYIGCENYEGKKILIVNKAPYGLKQLDPHFTKNGFVVARFVPDDTGWALGIINLKFLEMIHAN